MVVTFESPPTSSMILVQMKFLSRLKRYQKLLIVMALAILFGATVFYVKTERQNEGKSYFLISEMEIAMLQCRRAEKNFLMRHDRASEDRFVREVQTPRKHEAKSLLLGLIPVYLFLH